MKKIKFGHSDEVRPLGPTSVSISPELYLNSADYYGSATSISDDNYYIFFKVTEEKYNDPKLLNKFFVRQALCDLYADGSLRLLLNQEETETSKLLENYLNSPEIKDKITSDKDILNHTDGLYLSPNAFKFWEDGWGRDATDGTLRATSILPDVFERKNSAIKSCNRPISEIQEELNHYYTLADDTKEYTGSNHKK